MPTEHKRRQEWIDHATAAARPDGDTPNAQLLAELRRLNNSGLIRYPIGTIATAILIAAVLFSIIAGVCSAGVTAYYMSTRHTDR